MLGACLALQAVALEVHAPGVLLDALRQEDDLMKEGGMVDEDILPDIRVQDSVHINHASLGDTKGTQGSVSYTNVNATSSFGSSTDNSTVSRSRQGRIVLLPALGCSGSTFIWKTVKTLLEAHGEDNIWPCSGGKEFLKGKKECLNQAYCVDSKGTKLYWPADPARRLETALDLLNGKSTCANNPENGFAGKLLASDRPKVMLISGNSPDKVQAAAVEFLAQDTRNGVAGTVRTNELRLELCRVQDGWGGSGHQVHEDGTRSTVGIKRRKHSTEHTMVYLDPAKLKLKLEHRRDGKFPGELLEQALTKHGYAADFVTYEDLAAYEYDAKDTPRSMKAWTTLLRRAGVKVQPDLVKAELRRGAGTRQEEPLKSVIYNYDEVRSVLSDNPWESAGAKAALVSMLESRF